MDRDIYPRKKPKQERSAATVEAILEATARILSREGRARLSTNRVAELAGVSVGSLYQYFPNKESLVAELARRFDRAFGERLAEAGARAAALPLREAVSVFLHFMIDIHSEDPRLHNELAAEVPEGQRRYAREFVRGYFEAHRDEIRRPDLELAAHICLEVGEALTHGTALRRPELLRDPRFEHEVRDLILGYLQREESGR